MFELLDIFIKKVITLCSSGQINRPKMYYNIVAKITEYILPWHECRLEHNLVLTRKQTNMCFLIRDHYATHQLSFLLILPKRRWIFWPTFSIIVKSGLRNGQGITLRLFSTEWYNIVSQCLNVTRRVYSSNNERDAAQTKIFLVNGRCSTQCLLSTFAFGCFLTYCELLWNHSIYVSSEKRTLFHSSDVVDCRSLSGLLAPRPSLCK